MDKTGILIVDLQVGFKPSDELVGRIQRVIGRYDQVAMTHFTNQPGSLYRSILDWHGDGGDLVLQVPQAVILHKDGYGLTDQHLKILAEMQCAEWHVCGLETDACVLACAFSLWDAGLRPVIQPDLCESPLHELGVAVAARQFG